MDLVLVGKSEKSALKTVFYRNQNNKYCNFILYSAIFQQKDRFAATF